MRALSTRELDSVSGGFGLLGNLLGGLLGGALGGGQNVLAPAANTNTIPAANYVPNGYAAAVAAPAFGGGVMGLLSAPLQAISGFLQNPLGSLVSLVGVGIQQAVNFVTRLV